MTITVNNNGQEKQIDFDKDDRIEFHSGFIVVNRHSFFKMLVNKQLSTEMENGKIHRFLGVPVLMEG